MKRTRIAVGGICGALVAMSAEAQSQTGVEYSITPFVWAVSLDGRTQTGPVGGNVDVSFSDLLDAAEVVVPVHFEAQGPAWTLLAEINFTELSQDLAGGGGLLTGDLDVEMLIAELLPGYRLSDVFEILFGVRYVDIEDTLEIQTGPGPNVRAEGGEDWVDPVVGFRYAGPISRRWRFSLRGDVGGFGVGSELTWNVRAGFGLQISEVTTLRLGWHTLDFDFDDNDFVYDMTHQGPEIGATFRF